MANILAIDTSTDACSVALYFDGEYTERYEIIPRQHSQRLFPMLRELLPNGALRTQGIDAIAYASGPGSFTGLRIAASAVQGLAYSNQLPVIPISTLACQVKTALRRSLVSTGERVLSMLDARMNEVYWSLYQASDGLMELLQGPHVSAPSRVLCDGLDSDFSTEVLRGVGGGFHYIEQLPESVRLALTSIEADLLPSARDLIPMALVQYELGIVQQASEVMPVYVREEISWKKISEQGKRT